MRINFTFDLDMSDYAEYFGVAVEDMATHEKTFLAANVLNVSDQVSNGIVNLLNDLELEVRPRVHLYLEDWDEKSVLRDADVFGSAARLSERIDHREVITVIDTRQDDEVFKALEEALEDLLGDLDFPDLDEDDEADTETA